MFKEFNGRNMSAGCVQIVQKLGQLLISERRNQIVLIPTAGKKNVFKNW